MSIHAWAVLTKDQFENCKQPRFPHEITKPDYWSRLKLGGQWINKYPTADGAIEEARTSVEEWPNTKKPLELVICRLEFDDATCINALNAVDSGDSLGAYFAVCQEYLWYPSKEHSNAS